MGNQTTIILQNDSQLTALILALSLYGKAGDGPYNEMSNFLLQTILETDLTRSAT